MTKTIAIFQISTEEDLRFQLDFVGLDLTGRALRVNVRERGSNALKVSLVGPANLTLVGAGNLTVFYAKASMSAWSRGEYEADIVDETGGSFTRIMAVRFVYDDPGKLVYGVKGNQATVTWGDNQAVVTAIGGVGPPGPANTLEIGDVDTLETGEEATASITGSAPNQLLNLGLPKGNTGATGAAGTVTIGDVTTGAPGSSADVENVGTPEDAVLNITIPRGDVGATGTAGTIAVGEVTTSLPGSDAEVTNVGTAGAAIFDFVLPRGDQGPPGSVVDGDKGDIAVSGGGTVWAVEARAVSFGKVQAIASGRMLGRLTAGSGDIEELSGLQVLANVGSVLQPATSALVNGKIVESHVSNAVTIALKTLAGTDPSAADPALVCFTAADGSYVIRAVTAALSLTIPSTATMAAVNALPFNLYAGAFDDAGTVRLGATQQALLTAVTPLAARGVASSTAVGTGSDNAATWYTDSAVTSKAFTVLARLEWNSGLAAAGTWVTSPDGIELMHPGFRLPGQIVDRARGVLTANTTQTATTPIDNTIPAIGEGVELTTAGFPLKTGASRVKGSISVGLTHNTVNGAAALHVHHNSTTDAIAVALTNIAKAAGDFINGAFSFRHTPGVSGTSTYRLRAGANAGAFYTGGYAATPYFNGTFQSAVIDIEEIMA
ncbi:hypothetical protein LJR090_002565 [Bosea sp. LjRoot90]|uniref:hypothetical protein n=1 Tax=Bosea sp. LjRoot90 TaxID=3342342 RepID=UPI003ECD462A